MSQKTTTRVTVTVEVIDSQPWDEVEEKARELAYKAWEDDSSDIDWDDWETGLTWDAWDAQAPITITHEET